MKIKLISPARKPEWGESFWDSKTTCQFIGAKTGGAPLALATLAALTPSDIQIVLNDENVEPINFDEKIDMVGITSMTGTIPRAYEIADEYRKRNIPVIMGGIHVSMLPEEAIGHCNSVVIGEAEEIWGLVLKDLQNKTLQKYYHVPRFPDLTASPIPRWDLLKSDKYVYFAIQTGRGCPYDCDFCSVRVFNGRKYRHKNIQQVIEEIKFLQTINPQKYILFADDNLLSNHQYAEGLFNAIIALKSKALFICQASLNRLKDVKLLELMYKANCRFVFIGFESLSQKSIEAMNKNQINTVDEYKEIVQKIHSHRITVLASFALGGDSDDERIFEDTVNFINDTNILIGMFNILTPVPGTTFFERIKAENRLLTRDWYKFNGEFACIEPKLMSSNTLQQKRDEMLGKIYSYPILYKKLKYLWENDVLPREENSAFYIMLRILLTFKAILTSKFSLNRITFVLRCLWNSNNSSLLSVLMALNFHDYADSILRKKYRSNEYESFKS